MDGTVEKKISSLVRSQFPAFYNEEGPVFIEFVKAYYDWLEEEGKPTYYTRRFNELRDIDDTLDSFLYYFQKKYLYGIPFDVIINKRLLLKHVLDVYRSKSSLQCFKLLFKLIYNEDMELYLPGRDVLRASDGTWTEPRYIEISQSTLAANLVGRKIVGISSGTTGIVESYITEPVNQNLIGILYLSNITPKGGTFDIGEKVVDDLERSNTSANLTYLYGSSPAVIGSLDHIDIISGGSGFRIGDVLKIAHRDPVTNEVISRGVDGEVKVATLTRGRGQISFSIPDGGFGYTDNNHTFLYRAVSDSTGQGAQFSVGTLSDLQEITYCTDLVTNYLDIAVNAAGYGFPGLPTANLSSLIGSTLSYANDFFGSVASLTSVMTGNSYTAPPTTFVRTSQLSSNLGGTITYTSASPVITGTGTTFQRYFQANDTIMLQANTSLSNTVEYGVIKTVTDNTHITLWGSPTKNSTASAIYKAAPNPVWANYLDTTYDTRDANVYAVPFANSSSVVGTTKIVSSGKGYIEGEQVTLYPFGGIETPTILDGGTGYANGESILFAGGEPNVPAKGTITTNGSGTITSITMDVIGSGYQSLPNAYVKTANGSGASFSLAIKEFNTSVTVTGTVVKSGLGRKKGYWTTTKSFLNADKYIQDSYYYQDFSYQIDTAVTLDKYRDILYETFHIAGTEMFGKYLLTGKESLSLGIAHESNVAISSL